jgi:hypothetical protein
VAGLMAREESNALTAGTSWSRRRWLPRTA